MNPARCGWDADAIHFCFLLVLAVVHGGRLQDVEQQQHSCQMTFQCIGRTPEDTVVNEGTCREDCGGQSRFGKVLNAALTPLTLVSGSNSCSVQTSWVNCHFPTTQDYSKIGQETFFNMSLAAPSGHLKGIVDMSNDLKEKTLADGVQILTDLDDTLVCSGGVWPKGIDTSCRAKSFYDGVAELYYGLSLQQTGWTWGESHARLPIPASARPSQLKFALGLKACTKADLHFKKTICNCPSKTACIKGLCDCFGLDIKDAQYGDVKNVLSGDLFKQGDMEHLASTKMDKYIAWRNSRVRKCEIRSRSVRKEARKTAKRQLQGNSEKCSAAPVVFFGDNGQGDLSAAQRLLLLSQQLWRDYDELAKEPDFFMGSNSNSCPKGYGHILSFADCQAAAEQLGISMGTWQDHCPKKL